MMKRRVTRSEAESSDGNPFYDSAFDDAEVRAFIDGEPRHSTYTELAEACLERFGPDRAWSRSKIVRYWYATHAAKKGKAFRFDADPEVRSFLLDRFGRFKLTEIAVAARAEFGDRAPSRSAIHRFWKRVRHAPRSESGG